MRAFELTGANYFYAQSREITPPHEHASFRVIPRLTCNHANLCTRVVVLIKAGENNIYNYIYLRVGPDDVALFFGEQMK